MKVVTLKVFYDNNIEYLKSEISVIIIHVKKFECITTTAKPLKCNYSSITFSVGRYVTMLRELKR